MAGERLVSLVKAKNPMAINTKTAAAWDEMTDEQRLAELGRRVSRAQGSVPSMSIGDLMRLAQIVLRGRPGRTRIKLA
jgi:hypothetical protein